MTRKVPLELRVSTIGQVSIYGLSLEQAAALCELITRQVERGRTDITDQSQWLPSGVYSQVKSLHGMFMGMWKLIPQKAVGSWQPGVDNDGTLGGKVNAAGYQVASVVKRPRRPVAEVIPIWPQLVREESGE